MLFQFWLQYVNEFVFRYHIRQGLKPADSHLNLTYLRKESAEDRYLGERKVT